MTSGMHRLVDVRERLETVARMRLAHRALVEFRAALELSWWHCYSVRERAVEFLGVRANDKKAAGMLKSPSARSAALAVLSAKDPALTGLLSRLVLMLDASMAHRNMHTHGTYIGVAFDVGHDSYDPDDIIDNAGTGANGARIRSAVASAIRRKARECAENVQSVVECLSDLAMTGEPARHRNAKKSPDIMQASFP